MRIARATAGYSRAVSRRLRVAIVAAVALAAAAGVAVGAVVVAGDEPETKRPSGAPPFVVDLAVRTDPEAKALRRAAQAFERGDRRRAARILQGRTSLQARVGSAFAAWPAQTLARLEELAAANPSSGAVLFHLRARSLLGRRRGRRVRGVAHDPHARSRLGVRRPGLRPALSQLPARSPDLHPELPRGSQHHPAGPRRAARGARPGRTRPRRPGHTALRTRASAARPADLGPAAVRARRPARAPKPRSARRGRGGQVRQGAPRTGVLQARPAQSAVSTRSNRALPSRRAAPVAEPGRARPSAAANGRESDEIAAGKGSKAPPRPSRRRTKAVSNDRTARTERWAGRPMAVDVHRWKTPAGTQVRKP